MGHARRYIYARILHALVKLDGPPSMAGLRRIKAKLTIDFHVEPICSKNKLLRVLSTVLRWRFRLPLAWCWRLSSSTIALSTNDGKQARKQNYSFEHRLTLIHFLSCYSWQCSGCNKLEKIKYAQGCVASRRVRISLGENSLEFPLLCSAVVQSAPSRDKAPFV